MDRAIRSVSQMTLYGVVCHKTELSALSREADEQLLDLVRTGNDEAFDELYRRHVDVALRIARAVSHANDADDIVAEVFARIYENLKRSNGPRRNMRAYLTVSIRRAWIDRLRASSRQVAADVWSFEELLMVDDPTASIDAVDAIRTAFAQLTPRWQHVLWMSAIEGLSHAEIGEALGMNVNAVGALVFRARRAFRCAHEPAWSLNVAEGA